ncbi:MAG TPA: diaminopimelate epimerase [Candidatus Deferrimicrobium sp.]|nr:diaminopimelate epimerase [Candidatus Deferrimicrobium sp.]
MRFSKFQGLGNDYIIINEKDGIIIPESHKPKFSQFLCRRRYSIGADGVLFVCPPTRNDAEIRMRIFNADGSEAEMCGNGIRCFAKYVYEKGLTRNTEIRVETLAGIKIPTLFIKNGTVEKIEVNMGVPKLLRNEIPMKGPNTEVISEKLEVDNETVIVTCLSVGNPHCVIFTDDLTDLDITQGKKIELHEIFPKKINVEYVKVLNRHEISMRVWERGVGETLACGTGACASAVACVLNNKTDRRITVHLLGGDLEIFWDDTINQIYMIGPAEYVFEGEVEISTIK